MATVKNVTAAAAASGEGLPLKENDDWKSRGRLTLNSMSLIGKGGFLGLTFSYIYGCHFVSNKSTYIS